MRKLNKILAVLLSATMLFGCSNTPTDTPDEGGIAKVGFGMVSDNNGTQVNTTTCLLAVDAEGKIVSVDFDVAQQQFANDTELRTKSEKGADYNMKGSSPIGKEWFEQAEALETYLVGKTVADFTGLEWREHNDHTDVAPEGSDLYAVMTISASGFLAAIKEAESKLVEVTGATAVSMGEDISVTKDSQINTTVAAVATDADGKVVWAYVDVQQTNIAETTDFRSKVEKGDDYGMKDTSAGVELGKEWYEQANGIATWLVGKTLADVQGVATEEFNGHTDVAAAGSDLRAVATISLSGILPAVEEALGA